MIIVKLQGGLGNQMFQYAAGRALSLHHNVELALDLSNFHSTNKRQFMLDVFHGLGNKYINTIGENMVYIVPERRFIPIIKVQDRLVMEEPSFSYDLNFWNYPRNTCLDGYWQSEKYIGEYHQYIREDFQCIKSVIDKSKQNQEGLNSLNSVGVHIRRGDYVSDDLSSRTHGVLDMDYYKRAIDIVSENIQSPIFFVFTDEPDWARANFNISIQVEYADANNSAAVDLYLMTHCQHQIIANSSFSWWSAWLNQNPDKKIIAPKRWFVDEELNDQTGDLIPEGWIKI